MKLFPALLAAALAALPAAVNPQLKQVSTVYILQMASGMDQYLANHLTSESVFQVVADPQKADAIITDRLGEPFESKLNQLYPAAPPKEAKAVKSEKPDKTDKAGTESKIEDSGGATVRVNSFGRGRGNVFIVDRKTRNVLWSIYEPPKDGSSGELDRTAQRVVKRLKTDLTDKKQGS